MSSLQNARPSLRKAAAETLLVLAAWLTLSAEVRADSPRTRVATLDGTPVYHWRTLKSQLPDDVDRALVLREFERKGFRLPPQLVADRVRQIVKEQDAGDEKKFTGELRRQGLTREDFNRFITEETILSAMRHQTVDQADRAAKTEKEWLASLRAHASVQTYPPAKRHNG